MIKNTAAYIGRLRPPHNAHIHTMKLALQMHDQLVVFIGSSYSPRNIKNPFTFNEIEIMIRACFNDDDNHRLFIHPVIDHLYDDSQWLIQIQSIMENYATDDQITIFGHKKDETSYYLELFPQWSEYNVPNFANLNATDIRELFFSQEDIEGNWMQIATKVPKPVFDFLHSFKRSEDYKNLYDEYLFENKQKAAWAVSPRPPMFITTDAVVECSGHILLVKRATAPGKGLWALPGGFLKYDLLIVDSMIATLKEKTKIDLSKNFLEGRIRGEHVFDHPRRSLRGRTVTHAYHLQLLGGIPTVKGCDVKWFSLAEVSRMNEVIFEDHLDIISYFTKITKKRGEYNE
jgi:bifunctional NMN adenylyltransferase/nudix hydrolase